MKLNFYLVFIAIIFSCNCTLLQAANSGSYGDELKELLNEIDNNLKTIREQMPFTKKATLRTSYLRQIGKELLKQKITVQREIKRLGLQNEVYDPDFLPELKKHWVDFSNSLTMKFKQQQEERYNKIYDTHVSPLAHFLCLMVLLSVPSAAALEITHNHPANHHYSARVHNPHLSDASTKTLLSNNAACPINYLSNKIIPANAQTFFTPPVSLVHFSIDKYSGSFTKIKNIDPAIGCLNNDNNCAMQGKDSLGQIYFAKWYGNYDTKVLSSDFLREQESRLSNMASYLTEGLCPRSSIDKDLIIQEFIPLDPGKTASIFEADNQVRGWPWEKMTSRQREQYFILICIDLLIDNFDNHRKQFGVTLEDNIIEFDRGRAFWQLLIGEDPNQGIVPANFDHPSFVEERLSHGLFRTSDFRFKFSSPPAIYIRSLIRNNDREIERIFSSASWHRFSALLSSVEPGQLEDWIGPTLDQLAKTLKQGGKKFDRHRIMRSSLNTLQNFNKHIEWFFRKAK